MKFVKRLLAVIMALVMVLSISACSIHKKGEIALSVKDVEFTSAYYMCALISANSEAQQKVYDSLSEEELASESEVDYYSKKIDDKSYVKWVEDTALESLKKIAAYKLLAKENKVELSEEKKTEAAESATYLWNDQGYSQYFGINGISEATYNSFIEDSYIAEEYFMYIYGEEGTKALAEKDVIKETTDKYILVDILQSSYTEEQTEDQQKAMKELMKKNADYIKKGEKTFAQTYREFNNIEGETEEHNHEEGEEHVHPINEYAQVIGAEGTEFESEYYEKFKDYKVDQPKVIDMEDGSGCMLVIRRNLKKDEYYMDTLDSYVRHDLADDEFDKHIDEYIKKLDFKVNKFAISQFKVKKIKTPEAAY